MLLLALLLAAPIGAVQAESRMVLGVVERDLTGDGKPEILRLAGVRQAPDNLAVAFTIESGGMTVYRIQLAPLTRTAGFDGGRRVVSPGEYDARIEKFGREFFAEEKFQQPQEFVAHLRLQAPARAADIPAVIARDRQVHDRIPGSVIWQEIQNARVTIFTFSPGGDGIVAIGWNPRAGRFYRLMECC